MRNIWYRTRRLRYAVDFPYKIKIIITEKEEEEKSNIGKRNKGREKQKKE